MRKNLIRTAVIASLLTALTVSAVAYFAMPRPTVAQDGDQGVTLQPPAIQPANSSQSHPVLAHRAGYAPRSTTVARSWGYAWARVTAIPPAPTHIHEGPGRGEVIARSDFLRRGHRRHVDAPQKRF